MKDEREIWRKYADKDREVLGDEAKESRIMFEEEKRERRRRNAREAREDMEADY